MLTYDEMVRALDRHTPKGHNERSQLLCACGEFFGYGDDGKPSGWGQHMADVANGDID
jgi:hypothetical protein